MKLKMGLTNHYLRIGQRVRELLLGISLNSQRRSDSNEFNSRTTQMSMLISHRTKFNNRRLSVIIIGVITLIIGILLSSIPWLDYFILKNLRLWNDTLSYYYWQRPGVIRLTKLYIYNVTNPDGFLRGDKPKLREIGPFVYKEDMEKVNIKFHENFTVSYQHKKILRFVPELSIDKNTEIVTPNIPLLTLTSQSNSLGILLSKALSLAVNMAKYKPFISVTADQLAFGYDDALVSLAHTFYPKHKRPMDRMGLLIGRNGTLTEVSSIHTGHNSMKNFGYINKLNGLNYISAWKGTSCASVNGSEGSFFPPRDITKLNSVNVYDKDLCRVIPLVYQETVEKDGIEVDLFELDKKAYGNSKDNKENECFDDYSFAPEVGIQNISPCHYGAPVYLSNPHFYQTDDIYLNSVEGLTPNKTIHKTYFKIQPKIGVPLEGKVRIQLNLKVTRAPLISAVKDFRDFMFPIMWMEEGISELTPQIKRWIYLATVIGPNMIPILSYILILLGVFEISIGFIRAYSNFIIPDHNQNEILELNRRGIRSETSYNQQHQHHNSYSLLKSSNRSLNDYPRRSNASF